MSFGPLNIRPAFLVMLSLAFTGCSTIQVQVKETPGIVTGIEAGDCITVVLDFQGGSPQQAEDLEKSVGDCIAKSMAERRLSVRFMHPGEFRRTIFPGMDITSAPRNRDWIVGLQSSPQFQDKIQSLNLRYLIAVRERTGSFQNLDTDMRYYVGVAHGKNTELVALIIDLQKASDSGEVRVTVEDTGWYGCWSFVPVSVPAYTESRACQTLGRAVTKFLLGEQAGEVLK